MKPALEESFKQWWVEIMLGEVIDQPEAARLVKKFGLSFKEGNWQRTVAQKEMAVVLMNHVPLKVLLEEVDKLIKTKHPEKLNFQQAAGVYDQMVRFGRKYLADEFKDFTRNKGLAELVAEGEFDSQEIAEFFLQELLKLDRVQAKKKLKKHFPNIKV